MTNGIDICLGGGGAFKVKTNVVCAESVGLQVAYFFGTSRREGSHTVSVEVQEVRSSSSSTSESEAW